MKAPPKRVPFVSQLGRGWRSQRYGCGVASLMMLLEYHDELAPPQCYNTLARELGAYIAPEEKGLRDRRGLGVYRRDVEKWLRSKEVPCKIWVRRPRKNSREPFDVASALPVMAEMNGMRWDKCGHWIVCVRASAHKVYYLDPDDETGEIRSIPRSDFSKDWFGNAVGILASRTRAKTAYRA